MTYPDIIHHGSGEGITGSCHQLQMDANHSLLIDCGLFQGLEAKLKERLGESADSVTFPLQTLKLLIVTHVHADHVGRLPQLLAAGFQGPILCSEPSARLLPLILEDAIRLESAADSRDIQRYIQQVCEKVIPLPYDSWFSVINTAELVCRVRLQRAGHILGSAYVECDLDYPLENRNQRVVFSGDLGAAHAPILPTPKSPERADVLVLESTYGDRLHEDRATRQARLEAVIDKALADHGTVLIPAFSMGRTQELLYEIEDILHRKALSGVGGEGDADLSMPVNWPQLPIILDSPLASRLTAIYEQFDDIWDDQARQRVAEGRKPLRFRQLINIDSHAKHLQVVNYLASTGRPAIVLAGNGMCAGGRITNYLKAMLGDARHNVLFVGYQAQGTPGAAIQAHGAKGGYVELDGERYSIKAGVQTIGGYSAHADQQGLLDFVTAMDQWPNHIKLVHGQAQAKKKLGQALQSKYSLKGQKLLID